jgi:MFS transporter, AAHS family, 4-hydroxybenzoate transporter
MPEPATADVAALIDAQRIGRFQISTLVLCFAVLVLDGYDVMAMGNVGPALAEALGISRPALGPVFSAGLFGLMLGSLVFGSLADAIGRRRMIIASVAFFGAAMLATVMVTSVDQLILLRFATGLGLGGAFPNVIALFSEYAPRRARATLVTLMLTGFPVGAALSGVVVAWLVDAFGWRTVFYAGGLAPLMLAPLLVAYLPESIRFLVVKNRARETVATLLAKIDPSLRFARDVRFVVREECGGGVPVKHLFREGRALGTLLLWLAFFANLLALNFLTSWLPTLISSNGIPVATAVWSTVLYQIGGILGAVTLGKAADVIGAERALPPALLLAAVLISLAGSVGASLPLILVLCFGMGFCVVGGQTGLNAFAGACYPTFIRSTGAGWALGIGRSGSVLSGFLGTLLLSWHWPLQAIFITDGAFALVAAAAIFAMRRTQRFDMARSVP